MPRKRAKKSYHHGDLRAALLDAAVALIAERGLAHLSLRECARRAGVSHAAPYRHFADKQALLDAIAADGFSRLTDVGLAAMQGLSQPRDRIDAYGVAYVRFAYEYPVHLRVMFTTELDDPSEATQIAGSRAFDLLVDSAATVVGRETALLAGFAFWSLTHGLSMLILDGRVPPEHTVDADAAEALARSVLAMWRGPLATAR
jgi:AcrR family transcriptional regulator